MVQEAGICGSGREAPLTACPRCGQTNFIGQEGLCDDCKKELNSTPHQDAQQGPGPGNFNLELLHRT